MNFQEVILVPRSEYHRFDGSESKNLNLELARLKNNNSLSTHVRNTKYVEKLHDLMSSNKEMRAPMMFPLEKIANGAAPPATLEPLDAYPIAKIKHLLPAELRKKGLALYDRLRKKKDVVESEQSVKIGKNTLEHPLLDYVAESLRSSGGLNGHAEFVGLLKDAGIRAGSIHNADYIRALKGLRTAKKPSQAPKRVTKNKNLAGSIHNADYIRALKGLRTNKKLSQASKRVTKDKNLAGSGCLKHWEKFSF